MSRIFLYLLQMREEAYEKLRHPYDTNQGFVVRAASPRAARRFANERAADEGPIWEDPKLTTCRRLGEVTPGANTKPGIVLRDFFGC